MLRVAGGVRRDTVEYVLLLDAGEAGAADRAVNIIRVPGDGGVQRFPCLLPCHEGLSGAALLAGAAEKDHRARPPAALQTVLDGTSRGEGTGAEQVVHAAVARAAAGGALFTDAADLAEAGERVEFAEDADHGATAAEAPGEGGRNAAEVPFHAETELLQRLAIERRALILLQR